MDKFTKLSAVAAPLPMANIDTDMIIPQKHLKTIKREHAPWALKDFGIKCVIAPSFADIFYGNCFKNGILPITLPQDTIDLLLDDASRGANAIITVDLENLEISGPDGGKVSFEIDPYRRHCLLNGLDDIGLTLQKKDTISDYEAEKRLSQPWLFSD